MPRIYFNPQSDVKHGSGAQRLNTYYVTIGGQRHDVSTTHRGILAILRIIMPRHKRQNCEAQNG